MTFKDVPIRRKLIASMLFTCMVVVVLMQGAFFIYSLLELQKNTAQRLSTLGEITASNLTAALAFENQRDAQEILGALKAERHIVAAAIYDQDGRIFVQYSQDSLPTQFPSAPAAKGYRFDKSYLEGFDPIAERDRQLGTLYLKFDIGTVEREWLSGSLGISLAVVVVMLLIAYLLSQMLQRQISQPLLALAGTVKDISERQDFSIRAEKHGKDEIGQLTDGFNVMLTGIQEREDALRTANEALRTENEERNRAQNQLARAQKMEAVGQLTGGLAHDFNNILGVIIGNLDMAGEKLPPDAAAHEPCNEALDAALSAAELVKRLLAFSRRQPLRPKPTNLADVIANVQPLLARTLGEQIKITTASSPNAWLAMADPGQIESAILNLAINARDAMPTGGDLRIEQRNVTIDDAYALAVDDVKIGDYVVLTVTDTGSGMHPDVVARAFDPFFTTKAPGAGSGLGLSMVFGTMRQLGGTARIYSEAGSGTIVMLYLPRASEEDGEVTGSDVSAPIPGGCECVLMVEDNSQIRAIGAGILRSLGYQVVVAESGDDAMRQVENGQHFDALFSDIVMAGRLNGLALARELRKRKPGLPILLTSGFTSPATAHSDLTELGAELITKPYRKAELAERLRAVLDGPPNAVT
jgi:signal transduction histidine kinase